MKTRFKVYGLIIILVLAILFVLQQTDVLWRHLYPTEYNELVYEYSEKYDLDPYLIFSIIRIESRYNEDAVSRRGALGLMQLMPDTAKWIGEKQDIEINNNEDILNPETNIALGSWYLKHLIDYYDDKTIAIAAYNAGRGNVSRWLEEGLWDGTLNSAADIPFAETREYVYKVNIAHKKYREIYYD
ncbi:lytic transglycosylase domain-containing protein [Proteinivorax tanatarense]|uniref:Lytic transglycosylase domain-containing protein n=1 Tax=Proteinivorax tanatarense TaxID=1260629 RepID=A0AAU7VP62_9FIRM